MCIRTVLEGGGASALDSYCESFMLKTTVGGHNAILSHTKPMEFWRHRASTVYSLDNLTLQVRLSLLPGAGLGHPSTLHPIVCFDSRATRLCPPCDILTPSEAPKASGLGVLNIEKFSFTRTKQDIPVGPSCKCPRARRDSGP